MRTPDDFDAFYASASRRVLLHVYAVCGDLGDAQDITQEAFARAWQRWPTVSAYGNPEHWVRKVAWRLAARRWFTAQTRLGPPDTVTAGPSPERVALLAALRQLPEAQRRTVVMHYLLDMNVQEIAAGTDTPAGTVKARLARARAALAPLLNSLADDEILEASDATYRF
jgi:RNA polymerase sigma-70 factor, ECF subfamily